MKPLVTLLLLAATPAAPAGPDLHLFDYDRRAPLDFRDAGAQEVGGIAVHDISYASPRGGRVPAYLVAPPGKGPFPAVIFVHWGQGDRTEFLSEALILARAGAEALLIDGVFNRPGGTAQDFAHPDTTKLGYVQLVTDIRRGVDLMQSRPDVDGKRIAYVGHSYGATWGGALAGVEHRIRAHVLVAGLPQYGDLSDNKRLSDHMSKKYGKEGMDSIARAYAPLEPKNFVGLAPPATVMFQFAEKDAYVTPGLAKIYWEAAREPKLQKWYHASHELADPRALLDRDQFLEKQLGLRPVLPLILRHMGVKTPPDQGEGRPPATSPPP
jgi:dienelactone hydrolase